MPAGKVEFELAGKSLPELWQIQLRKRLNSKRVRSIFPQFQNAGEPEHAFLPKDDLFRVQTKLTELERTALPAAAAAGWCQGHEPLFCVVHGDLNAANTWWTSIRTLGISTLR